jgi:sugar phosphate isomerase/epimerase
MSASSLRPDVARTRTGHFPIGFRRPGGEWQKDLPTLLNWCRENQFGVIDLGREAVKEAPLVLKAGLRLGSVDLPEWRGMLNPDAAVRAKAVAENIAHIEACAAFGPVNHFTVMIPEKPELERSENFKYMVESYRQIAPVLEAHQSKIVIEGWPGGGVLCCTPESYGAFFRECPSPAMGVNYDPSHLLRMGIDPVRFVREFAGRVYHVHGKDTELFPEALYLYGSEQPPTLAATHRWGSMTWRYAIPGHGSVSWTEIFRVLAGAGYQGAVSIELEDENFNGTSEGEQAGLIHARNFLQSC